MTDSILIVGGGIAGLHAATECANAGARAIVVEQGPVVGGKLAAPMTEALSIGNRAEGVGTPLFEALADNENIEIITLARLENIEGRPGNFTASIRERARFVTDACTRCKLCRAVCPVVLSNEFDAGLTYRKAIYTPMAETLPGAWVIDIKNCLNTPPNYLPCNRCVEVCEDDAIFFNLPLDTVHERQVGAVILAPGFQIEDGADFAELGYGAHPDVVMSAELQRLLESPGPTGGYASKPSNEEYPERVLLVLDNPSPFALYIVASQVHQLLEQDVGTVAVLVLSQPITDSDQAQVKGLADRTGIQVHWGTMFKVDPTPENTLNVSYEDFLAKHYVQDTYDMVVLCSDVQPPDGLAELAQTTGIELADNGYIAVSGANGCGVATSRPGVFVAGCASGPRNIKASITDAQAAAEAALKQLDPRLLQSELAPGQERQDPAPTPPALSASQDDMRARIEQLLYALIGRPDT
ncbi:MAG: CoB--CoM heterodisulfide reductase iron-sulfur subunit A family protein [Proteobacteria bacterium]|nr:CoB--CoM heterodisulfide reductase iron-sulfur subunit A family protein [Pseudomonadota bacterium]